MAEVRVLYVDDEDDVRDVFAAVFGGTFDVTCAATGEEALALLDGGGFDVLVSDMRMEPMRGTEVLARAHAAHPEVQRILLTGFTDHDDLADAVNRGRLFAYAQKPWDQEQLRLTITRAADVRRLERENARLVTELTAANARLQGDIEVVVRREPPRGRFEVHSARMQEVLAQVREVASTDASVLLFGETGVGKELIASHIHELSPRRKGRFVAQNLAALPAELMTSELFGHVKGAFTGAASARRGLFELADGGTLFLDEIGEAPPALQALLLRALETREFWPVGGSEPRHVDVRIVAATNRDLLADARAGQFRADLYYRLAVCPIEVPPLRARPDDVRGIGAALLDAAARRMGRAAPRLGEGAWAALARHGWPGNVRELGNVMERLVIYHAGKDVDERALGLPEDGPASSPRPSVPAAPPSVPSPPYSQPPASAAGPWGGSGSWGSAPPPAMPRPSSAPGGDEAMPTGMIALDIPPGGTTFDDLEREILAQVLARADGNQSRAARSLGLSESTLRSRLKRLGLKG
ncbi:MAG: sigma-54-dependent Fis family transcriptional regulator [Myxococcales bacterium]|nr:sigma-54-dependent Fis family transcriptional regulator [Myxococcales bacterium]